MLKKVIKYGIDIVLINICVFVTLLLKFDFDFSHFIDYKEEFLWGILILTVSFEVVMRLLRGYKILWEFAGTRDRYLFTITVLVSNIPYIAAHILIFGDRAYPFSVYVVSAVFMASLLQIARVFYKIVYKLRYRKLGERIFAGNSKKIMIIGAGSAGNVLLQNIKNNPDMKGYSAACFIDDDPNKIGEYLGRVKIVGGTDTIEENVKKYNISRIIFAAPSCSNARRAEILNICNKTGCEVKTLPSIEQLINGEVDIRELRDIQVEDLLGRDPIKLNLQNVKKFIRGKTILVTGGGGSIGSELCRQIASYGVGRLIIFDIYENNAYDIQNELKRKCPDIDIVTLIGSVRDIDRLEAVFEKYHPEIVYHAAAHKHVPLMEDSPNEAVKNNVFGTLNLVRTADKYGVKRFIQISTDKAVNPTNVMGATKRICEMIIQSYSRRSKTEFVAVRFGNVLGSNGSVIPLFKRQIAEGGPVTVTHPDIIRYFMTIPEAVSLVLEAGVDAHGGEIFVLDMGQPVKILTLAENLIRLSGYIPYETMQIKFSGLRPGEKMCEELLMSEEGLTETENKLIFIGKPIEMDDELFFKRLDELHNVMSDDDVDIRSYIHGIVSTYRMREEK